MTKRKTNRAEGGAPRYLPKFPIWVQDWLSSLRIMAMTAEQEGGFLRLCLIQWQEGGLPADEATLLRLARISGEPRDHRTLLDGFPKDSDGMRRNAKVAEVRREAEDYCDALSDRSQRANAARWGKKADSGPKRPSVKQSARSPRGVLEESSPTPTPTLTIQSPTETAARPAKPARAKPTGAHQEAIDLFCSVMEGVTGTPYPFKGGRDGKAAKSIVEAPDFTLGELERRLRLMLADPWWAEKGVDLPKFAGQWASLSNAGRSGGRTQESAGQRAIREFQAMGGQFLDTGTGG